jgi:hypothetical protein
MRWDSLPAQWAESVALLQSSTVQKNLLPSLRTLIWKAETSRCLLAGLSQFLTHSVLALKIALLGEGPLMDFMSLAGVLDTLSPRLVSFGIDLAFPRVLKTDLLQVSSLLSSIYTLTYGGSPTSSSLTNPSVPNPNKVSRE